MEPKEIRFCLYAENEQQVREVQQALFDFVNSYYQKGVLVTAPKLTRALQQFKDNILIKTFLTK